MIAIHCGWFVFITAHVVVVIVVVVIAAVFEMHSSFITSVTLYHIIYVNDEAIL